MLEIFILILLAAAAYLMREELVLTIALVWNFFAAVSTWVVVFFGLLASLIIAIAVFLAFVVSGSLYLAYLRIISFFKKGAQ